MTAYKRKQMKENHEVMINVPSSPKNDTTVIPNDFSVCVISDKKIFSSLNSNNEDETVHDQPTLEIMTQSHNLYMEKNFPKNNMESKEIACIWVKFPDHGMGGIQAKDENVQQISVLELSKRIKKGEFNNRPVVECLCLRKENNQLVKLADHFVHPYFDIDIYTEKVSDDFDMDQHIEQSKHCLTKYFQCQDDEIMLSRADGVSIDQKGVKHDKYSCHFCLSNLKIKYHELGRWVKENIGELQKLHFDCGIYGENQSFRVVGSSKAKENRPLLIQNGVFEQHLITYLNGHEREFIPTLLSILTIKVPIKLKKKDTHLNELNKDDLKFAKNLVGCLSSTRSDLFQTWNEVGLCLHNLDLRLEEDFISFSQLSSKFNLEDVKKYWNNYQQTTGGLKLGSLVSWAKSDNELKYQQINKQHNKNSIWHLMLVSLSQTTSDCACVIHKMFENVFRFVDGKIWYYFNGTRWILTKKALVLKSKIVTDVLQKYHKMKEYYQMKASRCLPEEDVKKQKYLQITKGLNDVTLKLRDSTFKNKIIDELEKFFCDLKFEEKLDSNPHLIGFENGVYDLRQLEYRDGKPDDYLTFSTGYDYQSFNEDDDQIIQIYDYLKKTFPLPREDGDPCDLLDAVLLTYSSFLFGGNKHQHFYIQSNKGSNGKSQMVKFLDLVLGDYSKSVSSAFFLKQAKQSTQASPELACLKGVRLIHSEEPEQGQLFDIARIKELTGCSKITARGLFRDQMEFVPQFHCLFSCNKKPKIPNTTKNDIATWRRIKNLPFVSTFVDHNQPENSEEFIYHKDLDLDEKFNQWKIAMMYILIEHYKEYLKNGLPPGPKEWIWKTINIKTKRNLFLHSSKILLR